MAGVSDNENKDVAKSWIDEINPENVLDIGCGTGTYSMLAKQNHQNWYGLEVFYPYVKQYDLHSKYDEIFIADARYADYYKIRTASDTKDGFDLIIAADMLEHMESNDAKTLIRELLTHTKQLLICFPVEHNPQHAGAEGNDFETHVDHWHYDEMAEFLEAMDFTIDNSICGDVLAYFLIRGSKYDD